LLSLAGVIGILSGTGWVIVAAATALGFSGAATLTLLLALPPLLSPPDDIHRMTAAMFTISYSCAVIAPIISGLAWDASGIPAVAFAPIGLFACLMIGLASTLPRPAR
jgi:CP family cyanate transporter-like MFS transporter